jgi:hypothetical protein
MKNFTSLEFGWPHYKHPESNLISVFSASGVMSPILRKAREVFPGCMVEFCDFQKLEQLHESSAE